MLVADRPVVRPATSQPVGFECRESGVETFAVDASFDGDLNRPERAVVVLREEAENGDGTLRERVAVTSWSVSNRSLLMDIRRVGTLSIIGFKPT
jgi:hypothetical protein